MSFIAGLKHRMMNRSRRSKLELFLREVCGGRWPEMLDVGVADVEHSPFDNYLEKNCPHPERLTALAIQPLPRFKKRYPSVRAIVYNGGRFPFDDNAFEVVHCNAVLEHVGDQHRQTEFIRELARVGKKFFLTTPARCFPVEMHTNLPFVHYLPKAVSDRLLTMVGKEWAAGEYMHLLTRRALVKVLRRAGIDRYRIITSRLLGLPLHYYVVGTKEIRGAD